MTPGIWHVATPHLQLRTLLALYYRGLVDRRHSDRVRKGKHRYEYRLTWEGVDARLSLLLPVDKHFSPASVRVLGKS